MLENVKMLKGLSEAITKIIDEIDMDSVKSEYEKGGFKGRIILMEKTEILFLIRKNEGAEASDV